MYICICIFCVYIYIYHHLLKLFLKIMLPSQRAHKIGTPKLDVAVVAASPFPTSNVSSKPFRLTPTASHLDSKACEKSMTSEVSLRRFCCNFIVHVRSPKSNVPLANVRQRFQFEPCKDCTQCICSSKDPLSRD